MKNWVTTCTSRGLGGMLGSRGRASMPIWIRTRLAGSLWSCSTVIEVWTGAVARLCQRYLDTIDKDIASRSGIPHSNRRVRHCGQYGRGHCDGAWTLLVFHELER